MRLYLDTGESEGRGLPVVSILRMSTSVPPEAGSAPAGSPQLRRTALYQEHVRLGARLTDFGGWEMPLHYGSQIEEHHRVRRAAGMFDVSHMLALDVRGCRRAPFLRQLLGNDVGRLDCARKGACTPACCARTAASSTT